MSMTSFVVASDWISDRDITEVKTMIRNIPVPGPKKPS